MRRPKNVITPTHFSNFIAGLPLKLKVTLFGEAEIAQSSRQGMYILQKNQINGQQYYVQKGGLNGFWFIDTYSKWMLGPIQKLGEDYGGIQSFTMSPLNGKWNYFKDDQWIEASSNEIIISAGNFDLKNILAYSWEKSENLLIL